MLLSGLLAIAIPVFAAAPAGAEAVTVTPPRKPSPPDGEAAAPVAPTPPLVLLLDGLGVYVETDYIGVSALSRPLARQGFRTRTDSHLMLKTKGLVPDVIVGHSMGGETALRYAAELARAGYPAPLVITIDAAPAPPACTVPRCINIAGPGFARVRGAQNISAWAAGARLTNHAQLPTHPAVQQLILQETQRWMADWQARQAVAAAGSAGSSGRGIRSTGAKPGAQGKPVTPAGPSAQARPSTQAKRAAGTVPTSTLPKMWTVPGWSLPEWSAPDWPDLTRPGG